MTYDVLPPVPPVEGGSRLLDALIAVVEQWRWTLVAPIFVAALAFGGSWLLPPTYTSQTSFLPPQQQNNAAANLLSSLGALSGLAGATSLKSPIDQYVSLMESDTVADRVITRFDLLKVYDARFRYEARKQLRKRVHISAGKKDGLITVTVEDEDRQRAASMANAFVAELRQLTGSLALTEAQQRRTFFEAQLNQTRDRLAKAQQSLQESGFGEGALKAEPKAAAEGFATLRAEVTAAEVRLQVLRRQLTDNAPEVQQQLATLAGLKAQLAKVENANASQTGAGTDYVGRYREFKYQETLFELFSKQYELARLDESRDGSLVQVVDEAAPAERPTGPRHIFIAAVAGFASFALMVVAALLRWRWARLLQNPTFSKQVSQLRAVLGRQ